MSNKNGTTRPVGRPRLWENPEDLQILIDKYFKACEERMVDEATAGTVVQVNRPKAPTIVGLSLALDCSRDTIYDYGKKDEFSYMLKKAGEKCLDVLLNGALDNMYNSGIAQFVAKNFHGMKSDTNLNLIPPKDGIMGVIYLPKADLAQIGVTPKELTEGDDNE